MKGFAVGLIGVSVALLAYCGIRELSIPRPPPVRPTSIVRPPGVTVKEESTPTRPNQVETGKPDAVPADSEHMWGHPTKSENCETIAGLPDSGCTPGDINKIETSEIICSPEFHTRSVRDKTTTRTQKNRVYTMYMISRPNINRGLDQVCEIDHLVALELGGADTMANLWPECSDRI